MERTDSSISQQRTKAVVLVHSENKGKRKESVDSVDRMIAEEIKHIINDHPTEEPLPAVKEKKEEEIIESL